MNPQVLLVSISSSKYSPVQNDGLQFLYYCSWYANRKVPNSVMMCVGYFGTSQTFDYHNTNLTSYVIKVNYTAWWKHYTEYSQCCTLHCCLRYVNVLGSLYHDEVKDGHIYESTDIYIENNASKITLTYVNAALPSSMSLALAPGPAFPHMLTAMHMRSPHLLRK